MMTQCHKIPLEPICAEDLPDYSALKKELVTQGSSSAGQCVGLAVVHPGFEPARGWQWLMNPHPPTPCPKKKKKTLKLKQLIHRKRK